MPMHIEQPELRHCAPAALKISSSPSSSASVGTRAEPGTTIMSTVWAFASLEHLAPRRRSSIRPLVHEPMKTMSTATSRID